MTEMAMAQDALLAQTAMTMTEARQRIAQAKAPALPAAQAAVAGEEAVAWEAHLTAISAAHSGNAMIGLSVLMKNKLGIVILSKFLCLSLQRNALSIQSQNKTENVLHQIK